MLIMEAFYNSGEFMAHNWKNVNPSTDENKSLVELFKQMKDICVIEVLMWGES